MLKMKKLLALVLALTMVSCCALAEKVSVDKDEYESLQKYEKLEEILQVIDAAYLWDYDVDELLEGAAQGMIGALGDQYSYYYTAADVTDAEESYTGQYGGLGIEVFANANDLTITIRRVFYGSPAQEGGLRPNDKIIAVNGEDLTAYDLNKAVSIMRGEVGGEVTLTILRESEVFDVTLTRAIVETQIIDSEVLDGNIGYIRVHYFEGNLDTQFQNTVEEFQKTGVKGLVIDLRDNGGGYVDLATAVADIFIDDDVIFSSKDKYGRKLAYYADPGAWDIPVVLILNKYSASASEILAGALRDSAGAELVGTVSFGKGIMQSVYTFSDGESGMQTTSEYWYTPGGECIHGEGLKPDVEVELPEDALDENFNIIREKDTQLQAAAAEIEKMLAGETADASEEAAKDSTEVAAKDAA